MRLIITNLIPAPQVLTEGTQLVNFAFTCTYSKSNMTDPDSAPCNFEIGVIDGQGHFRFLDNLGNKQMILSLNRVLSEGLQTLIEPFQVVATKKGITSGFRKFVFIKGKLTNDADSQDLNFLEML